MRAGWYFCFKQVLSQFIQCKPFSLNLLCILRENSRRSIPRFALNGDFSSEMDTNHSMDWTKFPYLHLVLLLCTLRIFWRKFIRALSWMAMSRGCHIRQIEHIYWQNMSCLFMFRINQCTYPERTFLINMKDICW